MWKLFNKTKPKEKGWYLCTVEVKGFQRYVMELYWYPDQQKFIDNIRQNVCETYFIKSEITGERVYDIGQDRTKDVIAWKKNPKPYMKGFKKNIYYITESFCLSGTIKL